MLVFQGRQSKPNRIPYGQPVIHNFAEVFYWSSAHYKGDFMKHSKRVKKMEGRRRDYEYMMSDRVCVAAMAGRERGYHKPGSVSK